MAEAPYMKLWTGDYLADTGHLTTIEHGAYLLLLMAMWRAGGTLPNDDKLLARYAHLGPKQWRRIRVVLEPFFHIENEQLLQRRLTAELVAVRQQSKRQSDNAKSKPLKTLNGPPATAKPNGSQTTAYHSHSHSKSQKEDKKTYKKEFEDWYSGYPKKVGRGQAERAFKTARKLADLETLKAGLANYLTWIEAEKPEPKFIKNPATWLNGQCWEDVYEKPAKRKTFMEIEAEMANAGS